MKEHMRRIAIILGVLLVTQACQFGAKPESGEENDARTYYESLNLQTPEEAVQTFGKAFQREDFMTVFLVLGSEAQNLLRVELSRTFSWRHLIGEDAEVGVIELDLFQESHDTQIDSWYLFDQVMLFAAEEDDLLIDLRGDLDTIPFK